MNNDDMMVFEYVTGCERLAREFKANAVADEISMAMTAFGFGLISRGELLKRAAKASERMQVAA